MTRDEREAAIVAEAQLRANSSGMAQRVYYRFGVFCIGPEGGEEVAVIVPALDPQDVARAYEAPSVAPAAGYLFNLEV